MKTLQEEIQRIWSEVAEISSNVFYGKSIAARVKERFPSITPLEYDASEKIWDELYRERRKLQEALEQNRYQIKAIEAIIQREIQEG